MTTPKINGLSELLTDFLGQNKTVIDHETFPLTAIGDNFGSLLLGVKIDVKDGEKKETIEGVAKLPHPAEFIQAMYNCPVTFRNEINFYKIIVPQLKNFIKERNIDENIDCFPLFYGGRLNLSGEDCANKDAVLLMENLKVAGYTLVDKTKGFDLTTTKIILKGLAKLHAVPVAMKQLKPDAFNEIIKSHFAPYSVFKMPENMLEGLLAKMLQIVEAVEEFKPHAAKIESVLRATNQWTSKPKNSPEFVREPFATIIHSDAWINNFMVKFVDGKPTDAKMVDFQLYEYGSPARDIIFFIFTSVEAQVLQEHYDDLIEYYHKSFIEILEKLNCDTSAFSREEFQKELVQVSKDCEFLRALLMLEALFTTSDNMPAMGGDFKQEDLIKMMTQRKLAPGMQEKAVLILQEFLKRKLIE